MSYLVLAWTEPASAPPLGNVSTPLNIGNTGQSKAGGLILNTDGAATGLIVQNGNVGIGTTSPGAKLDVAGGDIVITKNGVSCPTWKDCDGEGKTYGNGDCDESCPTCYVGSTAYTLTPDGKDQNCDGVIDNQVTISTGVVANDRTGLSCNSKCANAGYNTCLSVGNDAAGTNRRVGDYAWSNCVYIGEAYSASCSGTMWSCNQGGSYLNGYSTNCSCATVGYR